MYENIGERVILNDGCSMPVMGMGTDKVWGRQMVCSLIRTAAELGYRHIDTATWYKNEKEIGLAIKACGVPRNQLFITTKLNNPDQGYDTAIAACERSLKWLKLDYIDLYLIHWPGLDEKNSEKRLKSYEALIELKRQGKVRSIGVSNFQERHIMQMIESTSIVPAVNQIERHPWQTQAKLKTFLDSKGIRTVAWAPLMRGKFMKIPLLAQLGKKYEKTPAQVILRWNLQSDVGIIPKTEKPERLKENSDIFNFALSDEDMEKINSLNQDFRLRYHPDTMDVGFLETV